MPPIARERSSTLGWNGVESTRTSGSGRSTSSNASATSTTNGRRRCASERLVERGYGDAYIRADLEQRGLPAEEALAAVAPEVERAERFAEKGPAWLARRGFALEG